MPIFENYFDEDGYEADISLEDFYEELTGNEKIVIVDWLTEEEFIPSNEEDEIQTIKDEDFNDKLDRLKSFYYRLSKEEEELLNRLFNKYL